MDFTELQTIESQYHGRNGKFFQMLRGESDAINVIEPVSVLGITADQEVHDHLCPDGSAGFTLYEYRKRGNKKEVRSFGHGCGSSTNDWALNDF